MPKHILLINGPNLNLLGLREPHIYGSTKLDDILSTCTTLATERGYKLTHFQSNWEGAIVDHLHTHYTSPETNFDFVIVNPGALTHTSVALRDALLAVGAPFLELHVSNVHAREEWRGKSYLSDKAVGVVCGLGVWGYEVAVEFAGRYLRDKLEDGGGKGPESAR